VPEHPWQREKHLYLPPALAKKLAFIALGAVAMLAVGQVLVKKPMNIVRTIPGATNLLFGGTNRLLSSTATMTNPVPATLERAATIPAPTNALTAQAPTNPAPVIPTPTPISPIPAPLPQAAYSTSKTPRLVTTHNGMFVYDLSQLPVLGSPSAANVVISLFDYTCHHCHTMHGQILEALQQLSNQVAIVNLPMPLDAECNPAIYRTHRTASNACNYARLGLAVWRAAPEQLAKFDAFMFSKMPQPPLAEANTFAANLVGADKLGRALMDPWVAEQLKRDVSIYQTNIAVLHNGAMPQLILGSKVSAGVLNSTADLIKLIRENQQ
jgi:protein-disulfide isomerase